MSILRFTAASACLLTMSCIDLPAQPDLAGASIIRAENVGEGGSEMQVTVSLTNQSGHAAVNSESARFYVKQTLLNGQSNSTVLDFEEGEGCEFAHTQSRPAQIALVIDRSSLYLSDSDARQLAFSVSDAVLQGTGYSQFAVVNVGTDVSVDLGFSTDLQTVATAVTESTVSPGGSQLNSGIAKAVQMLDDSGEEGVQKGVVVIAAARDTLSGALATYKDLAEAAELAEIPVMVLALEDATVGAGSDSAWALDDVASQSGGRFIPVGDVFYVDRALAGVVNSLKNAYQMCVPAMLTDGGQRFASPSDLSSLSVSIESDGSEIETVRLF